MRRSSRKRQTRISFGPATSTSNSTSNSTAAAAAAAAANTTTPNAANTVGTGDPATCIRRCRRKRRKISDDDDDDDSTSKSESGSDLDFNSSANGNETGNVKAECLDGDIDDDSGKSRVGLKMEIPKKQTTLWIHSGEEDGSAKGRTRYGLQDRRSVQEMGSHRDGGTGVIYNQGDRDRMSSEDPLNTSIPYTSASRPAPERSSKNRRDRNSGLVAKQKFDSPVPMAGKVSTRARSGKKLVAGTGLFKGKGVPRLKAEPTNDTSDDGGELDSDEEMKDGNRCLYGKNDEGEDHEVKAETRFNDENGGENYSKSEEDEEKEEGDDDDDDSDEVIMSSSRRKRMRKTRITISSSTSGEDSSVDLRKGQRRRRCGSNNSLAGDSADILNEKIHHGDSEQAQEDENEDDEEEDFPISRKRMNTTRKPAGSNLHKAERDAIENEEIQEDLEDLQSSLPQLTTPLRGLSTLNPKQHARRKALELLKQRRAGERTSDTVDIEEKLSQGEKDSIIDGSISDNVEDLEGVTESNYPTARDMFGTDRYDEDFLDDDGAESGTDNIGVPLQFSKVRYYKAKDLFKYAVEWMVQKKINPGFAMNDEIYQLTFIRLKDEAIGLGSLTYTSSAWTASFKHSLEARPELEYHEIAKIDRFGLNKCDACNRSGHPATWQVRFTGNVYDKDTLEEIEGDEEDENSEVETHDGSGQDYEKEIYDDKGNRIPPASTAFNLGRFCMQNARMAHAFAHWRYHLNVWTIDYLENEGYLTPEKIVERDSWNTRKRSDYANRIVDDMEENGEIKRLYRDYKNEITTARTSKQFVLDGIED